MKMIRTDALSGFVGLGLLLSAGLANADTLVTGTIPVNGDISGNEVISSGTLGGTAQGWFTTAAGQTPATVTGTGSNNNTLPLNVLDLSQNGSSNYTLHDNFAAGQASNSAGNITVGGVGQAYGFVDTYVLNLPTGTASNFDVSVAICGTGLSCAGITNLTARLYEYTANGASNLTVGGVAAPAGGTSTVVASWTQTQGSGAFDYTSFNPASVVGGEYVLQVAGLAQSGGGSFSGVLGVTPVPLPAGLALLASGLIGFGPLAARRRNIARNAN